MKKIFIAFVILGAAFLVTACTTDKSSTPTPYIVENPVIPDTPTPEFSCSVIHVEPTPVANTQSLVPPVSNMDFSIGPADAPVTILEYCDFQSQGCQATAQAIGELMRSYDGSIRFVFRPLPLTDILDKSDYSVLAAYAADEQGKFWEMYDLLFVHYSEWANQSQGEFKSWLAKQAPSVGIDADKLAADMKAETTLDRMKSDYETAKQLAIPAVPLLLINGDFQYVLDYRDLSDSVGLILLGKRQFTECPPFMIDAAKQYIATIETEKGNIIIQLFPDKAPLAVNSFVFLAKQGWYDGVTFHRVIPGFAAQAGDPSGTGRGNPGYFFKNEPNDLLFTKPGVVGMANSGPDTNGSQFFITFAPEAHLNGNYTIFGQVIKGLEVAEQLTPRDPSQSGVLPPGDKILRITIDEQ